tara:strand:- start:165 stop:356 length:192 start_codon:yes stop_codon:yes gene_type:complete
MKNKNVDRITFLKSLPKDNEGNPIIDEDAYIKMGNLFWELEFLENELDIVAQNYPEYYRIPEK